MNRYTAILDACVLYPSTLRSFFMYLAVTDLFRARWTNDIHEEWMRSVQKNYPNIDRGQVERIRDLMNANVRDCLVSGYEALVPALSLPDHNDCHVLAAAIKGEADAIVTFNLKHFPKAALEPLGIEALHPDDFLRSQLDLAPNVVCAAAKRQRESLKNPALSVAEYLNSLERQGLPQTIFGLRQFADLI